MKKLIEYEILDENIEIYDGEFENKIHLGEGKIYYILMDKQPYLQVEVDTKVLFDNAIIFNDFLMIGVLDKVYCINLRNIDIIQFDVDMYFGYFEIYQDRLYVLDGRGVIAFDENMIEIWRNHTLAVDGVCCFGYQDEKFMLISCEIDPPGDWVEKKIELSSGKEYLY